MNLFKTIKALFQRAPRVRPAEAADRIRSGGALLIDVRQPGEWGSGVAEGAILLPLTDLMGARKTWTPFLAQARDRELLFYCAAGGRSAVAARVLASEGFRTGDAGALADWANAGWPIVPPPSKQ